MLSHHGPKPTSSQPKLKFSCPKPNPKSYPILPKPKTNPTQHNQKPSPAQPSTKCSLAYPILELSPSQPSTKPSSEQPNQIPRPYQPSQKYSPTQPRKTPSPSQPNKKPSSTKPSNKSCSIQPRQKCCATPPSLKPHPAQPSQKLCSSQSNQKPCSTCTQPIQKPNTTQPSQYPSQIQPSEVPSPTQPSYNASHTQPSEKPNPNQSGQNPSHTQPSKIPENMTTKLHPESEPDASLPKVDKSTFILRLPSVTTLFLLYLQLCSPFFLLLTLAQCDIDFLAVILPFPILITTALFSVCFIDMSHPPNDDQNNHCKTDKTHNNSNKQTQENKLSSNNEDDLNEQIIHDEDSDNICISVLTFIKALLCLLILYECQFNFIEHQPFGSLLFRGILATVLRVQCSLIIISMHVLPEKIVGSLVGIYEQENNKDIFLKKKTCSGSLLNFLHVMRFRTLKHKKQRLVLNKNWKHAFNRISNFQKEFKKPFLFFQEPQNKNKPVKQN